MPSSWVEAASPLGSFPFQQPLQPVSDDLDLLLRGRELDYLAAALGSPDQGYISGGDAQGLGDGTESSTSRSSTISRLHHPDHKCTIMLATNGSSHRVRPHKNLKAHVAQSGPQAHSTAARTEPASGGAARFLDGSAARQPSASTVILACVFCSGRSARVLLARLNEAAGAGGYAPVAGLSPKPGRGTPSALCITSATHGTSRPPCPSPASLSPSFAPPVESARSTSAAGHTVSELVRPQEGRATGIVPYRPNAAAMRSAASRLAPSTRWPYTSLVI